MGREGTRARRGGSSLGREGGGSRRQHLAVTHRHVEHTGTGWQKTVRNGWLVNGRVPWETRQSLLDRHTEQTKPISTMRLWQKQAARKSTLSWVGTEISWRMAGGGRNDIFEISISEAPLWRGSVNAYHHVLQHCVHALNLYVRAASQMCCLLQEHVLRPEDLANVYCNLLRAV